MKTKIKEYTLAFISIILFSSFVSASVNCGFFSNEAKIIEDANNCTLINYERAMAVSFNLDEENYVNDIPFNTNVISEEYNYLNAISEDYEIIDEKYIDDIPFSTKRIVQIIR